MKQILSVFIVLFITGCNSMTIKPNTLDKSQIIFADRGGYSMKRSIKDKLEERGYKIVVGKATGAQNYDDIEMNSSAVPSDARYIIKVNERKESMSPIWCIFNGMWWWNFNVSIADQKTGVEILTWRGRGCSNSSMRKLDVALDKLEIE